MKRIIFCTSVNKVKFSSVIKISNEEFNSFEKYSDEEKASWIKEYLNKNTVIKDIEIVN